jgi:hypothetical protein
MNRPLKCNVITNSGDEIWTPGAFTLLSSGIVTPASGSMTVLPVSTSSNTITSGVGYSINVTLLEDATFTATITDSNGCITTATTTVLAEDVRCFAGNSGVVKVMLCHKTGSTKNPCVSICVDQNAVDEHLAHGDFFGKCTTNCLPPNGSVKPEDTNVNVFEVTAYPNPSRSLFTFEVESNSTEKIDITIFDIAGRIIKQIQKQETIIQFGEELPRGVYLALIEQGGNRKTVRIIKE